MDIKIIQKKFTLFRNRYDVFVDNNLIYTAKSVLFSLTPKIKVFDLLGFEIFYIVRENLLDVNLPNYQIVFKDTSITRFIIESFTHYKIYVSQGIIDVYVQKSRKLGLFLNNIQIGIIDKNKIVKFGGDIYSILIDNKVITKELAIAIALIYDSYEYSDSSSMVKIDFGNIATNNEREIDINWKP